MERSEFQLESLPLKEYNALEAEVVSEVARRLGMTLENCLLECSADFRALVTGNSNIAEELKRDRPAVVTRLTEALLERRRASPAAQTT